MVGIRNSKYYEWRKRLGLENNHNGKTPKSHWLIPEEIQAILDYARSQVATNCYCLKDGYRRIAYMGLDAGLFAASPSSVYRVLSREGLLNKWQNKSSSKGQGYIQPTAPHQEWHTDIKYINFHGTFLFFISVMDGYSRYILHHEIRESMTLLDVEITIQRAHEKYPDEHPRIISDNGGQYIAKEFGAYIKSIGLQHTRTSVAYPQSNGKIERFHKSLGEECLRVKSLINIDDARQHVGKYVEHYNNRRLHSALYYLRPVDFLEGNVDALLKARQEKLDKAAANRVKYWREKKEVA
jgi:transposase InsO family protein